MSSRPTMPSKQRSQRFAVSRARAWQLAMFVCACVAASWSSARATPPSAAAPGNATPSTAPNSNANGNGNGNGTANAPATAATPAVVPPAPAPPKTTAEISFTTVPPADAFVTWGKTRLGRITPLKPLVIVRPRDSGPLDVMVRAEGFLPVQTRAHTFSDSRIAVKLTKPEETSTLLGYRVPIAPKPAETAGAPGDVLGPVVSPEWNMTAPANLAPVTPVTPGPVLPTAPTTPMAPLAPLAPATPAPAAAPAPLPPAKP